MGRDRTPWTDPGWRVSRLSIVGGVLASAVLALSACGGAAATATPSGAAATAVTMAGSFADLPFTLTMPDGWAFGTQKDVASELAALEQSDTADAGKLREILAQAPTFTSEFVAYDVASNDSFTPNVSCNTLDRGNMSPADALAEGQAQNVAGLSQLPGIIGTPTADRMVLPVGEAVRVRWRATIATSGADVSSIGYLFVAGPTVYTCVFSAGTPTIATHEPEWEAILRSFAAKPSASVAATTPSADASACPTPAAGIFPHQAPELEGALPSLVTAQPLIRWSVRGRCWLEEVFSDPARIDPFVAQFTTPGNPHPIDDANLVYGVAGRSIDTDPPSIIYAAVRPANDDEIGLVLYLLIGGAGFHDIAAATDLTHYQSQTIAGRPVYVGTTDMLTQDTHQRGRPYLYQTDRYMFLVITDDDAWAADAISQLP